MLKLLIAALASAGLIVSVLGLSATVSADTPFAAPDQAWSFVGNNNPQTLNGKSSNGIVNGNGQFEVLDGGARDKTLSCGFEEDGNLRILKNIERHSPQNFFLGLLSSSSTDWTQT